MKRNRLALAVLACSVLAGSASGATVFILGGNQTLNSNGSQAFSGSLNDGGSVAFSGTLMASGMDENGPDEVQILQFVTFPEGVRLNLDDNGNNQTTWTASWTFNFASPLTGIALTGDPLGSNNVSDYIDWTLSWTASSGTGTLINATVAAGLFSVPPGGGKLADGAFAAGTSFRWDGNDTPNEGDFALREFSILLPSDVTQVILSATVHDISGLDLQNEGLGLDFAGVEIVPEPSSYLLMGSGLLGLWAMRRKRQA